MTRELIGDLVGVRHGETVADWRDAVLDDDTARATALIEPVLSQSGVSGVKLVTLLGTTLVGRVARARTARRGHARPVAGAVAAERHLPRPAVRPPRLARRAEAAGRAGPSAGAPSGSAARWRATLAADQSLKSTTLRDETSTMLDLVLELAASKSRRAA